MDDGAENYYTMTSLARKEDALGCGNIVFEFLGEIKNWSPYLRALLGFSIVTSRSDESIDLDS